jgi:lycopene beta-cyclase
MNLSGAHTYDYIIAGGGAAGLSLAVHLLKAGLADTKKILLIERDEKNQNDRTWCFWEKDPGLFEDIVYKQWDRLTVWPDEKARTTGIHPYRYKMIRGIDFYRHANDLLHTHKNIHRLKATVSAITHHDTHAVVTAGNHEYHAAYVFSSLLLQEPQLKKNQQYLLQHFRGWMIETEADIFDETTATFMDFRVDQQQGATFVYVLPFSSKRALVEYTLFSGTELDQAEYEKGLSTYIETRLRAGAYKIIEKEQGIIPMTDYTFPVCDGRIIYIGTAGGNTRGSSGYTFRNIQKHSALLVQALAAGQTPVVPPVVSKKARFFDAVLLQVLGKGYANGKTVFGRLFRKMKIAKVLHFLDGESTWSTDLQVITSQPKWPFLKAAWKKIRGSYLK